MRTAVAVGILMIFAVSPAFAQTTTYGDWMIVGQATVTPTTVVSNACWTKNAVYTRRVTKSGQYSTNDGGVGFYAAFQPNACDGAASASAVTSLETSCEPESGVYMWNSCPSWKDPGDVSYFAKQCESDYLQPFCSVQCLQWGATEANPPQCEQNCAYHESVEHVDPFNWCSFGVALGVSVIQVGLSLVGQGNGVGATVATGVDTANSVADYGGYGLGGLGAYLSEKWCDEVKPYNNISYSWDCTASLAVTWVRVPQGFATTQPPPGGGIILPQYF